MPHHLQSIGVVSSTNDHAFEALDAGRAEHGDAFLAEGQTAGRGRLGHRWVSPPGEGVYLSLVWAPPLPPEHPAAITMAAGLAVRDALHALRAHTALLKWPNDVLLGDGDAQGKVAGILVETRGGAGAPFVVGVGVNVLQREFPAELRAQQPVTSLALAGCSASVGETADAVVGRLRERLAALGDERALEREYLRATQLRGQRVRVTRGEEACEGFLEDISLRDGICLRRRDGWLARVPVEHATGLQPIGT